MHIKQFSEWFTVLINYSYVYDLLKSITNYGVCHVVGHIAGTVSRHWSDAQHSLYDHWADSYDMSMDQCTI